MKLALKTAPWWPSVLVFRWCKLSYSKLLSLFLSPNVVRTTPVDSVFEGLLDSPSWARITAYRPFYHQDHGTAKVFVPCWTMGLASPFSRSNDFEALPLHKYKIM